MKKLTFLISFLFFAISTHADVIVDGVNINAPKSKTMLIQVVFNLRGWHIILPDKYREGKELRNQEITDENGNKPEWEAPIGILNWLELNGWEYIGLAPLNAVTTDKGYLLRRKS